MRLFTVLFLLVGSTLFAQTTQTFQTLVGTETRSYIVYIPASYAIENVAVPVVFNFHGYGSNMTEQLAYGDFRGIADTANFLIVAPNGTSVNGQNGWQTASTVAAFQKELDFVQVMLNELNANFQLNPARIYSTGMSNGGFMSYGLACFMNEKFAAIASVTGGMSVLFKNGCTTNRPMPVLQIHGTDDAIVNYNGAFGILSIDELTKFWMGKNGTKKVAEHTLKSDLTTSDNSTAEWFVWKDSLRHASVELFKINGGGHTWPGALFPVNGNTNMDINASKEIWRFFQQYSLDEVLTSAVTTATKKIELFVDQSTASIEVKTEQAEGMNIALYDLSGRLLKTENLNANTVSISTFQSGVYVYQLLQQDRVIQTGKIVKD